MVAGMSATPPGWYDDGHGARRWWDGAQWTEHVESAAAAPAATITDAPAPQAAAATHAATTDAVPSTWTPGAGASAPAYPGSPAYPAYPPVAPAKKSNLWIVWVVLGVLALGAVITAIIVVPMLLVGLFGQGGSSGGALSADETAAVEAVQLYDQAWQDVDCDLYFAVTTEAFRDEIELPDCASFDESAGYFAESTDDYVLEITDAWTEDEVIMVATDETYSSTVDENGEPLSSPESVTDLWEYYLIDSGGAWVIDDAAPSE